MLAALLLNSLYIGARAQMARADQAGKMVFDRLKREGITKSNFKENKDRYEEVVKEVAKKTKIKASIVRSYSFNKYYEEPEQNATRYYEAQAGYEAPKSEVKYTYYSESKKEYVPVYGMSNVNVQAPESVGSRRIVPAQGANVSYSQTSTPLGNDREVLTMTMDGKKVQIYKEDYQNYLTEKVQSERDYKEARRQEIINITPNKYYRPEYQDKTLDIFKTFIPADVKPSRATITAAKPYEPDYNVQARMYREEMWSSGVPFERDINLLKLDPIKDYNIIFDAKARRDYKEAREMKSDIFKISQARQLEEYRDLQEGRKNPKLKPFITAERQIESSEKYLYPIIGFYGSSFVAGIPRGAVNVIKAEVQPIKTGKALVGDALNFAKTGSSNIGYQIGQELQTNPARFAGETVGASLVIQPQVAIVKRALGIVPLKKLTKYGDIQIVSKINQESILRLYYQEYGLKKFDSARIINDLSRPSSIYSLRYLTGRSSGISYVTGNNLKGVMITDIRGVTRASLSREYGLLKTRYDIVTRTTPKATRASIDIYRQTIPSKIFGYSKTKLIYSDKLKAFPQTTFTEGTKTYEVKMVEGIGKKGGWNVYSRREINLQTSVRTMSKSQALAKDISLTIPKLTSKTFTISKRASVISSPKLERAGIFTRDTATLTSKMDINYLGVTKDLKIRYTKYPVDYSRTVTIEPMSKGLNQFSYQEAIDPSFVTKQTTTSFTLVKGNIKYMTPSQIKWERFGTNLKAKFLQANAPVFGLLSGSPTGFVPYKPSITKGALNIQTSYPTTKGLSATGIFNLYGATSKSSAYVIPFSSSMMDTRVSKAMKPSYIYQPFQSNIVRPDIRPVIRPIIKAQNISSPDITYKTSITSYGSNIFNPTPSPPSPPPIPVTPVIPIIKEPSFIIPMYKFNNNKQLKPFKEPKRKKSPFNIKYLPSVRALELGITGKELKGLKLQSGLYTRPIAIK